MKKLSKKQVKTGLKVAAGVVAVATVAVIAKVILDKTKGFEVDVHICEDENGSKDMYIYKEKSLRSNENVTTTVLNVFEFKSSDDEKEGSKLLDERDYADKECREELIKKGMTRQTSYIVDETPGLRHRGDGFKEARSAVYTCTADTRQEVIDDIERNNKTSKGVAIGDVDITGMNVYAELKTGEKMSWSL